MKRFLIIMQSFSAQCNSFYFHCFLAMDCYDEVHINSGDVLVSTGVDVV